MPDITLKNLIRKISDRMLAVIVCIILSVSGVVMIFKQIGDSGHIDITSPFLSGKIQTGLVGVSLIFFTVIIFAIIFRKTDEKDQEMTITIGELNVSYKNMGYEKVLELNKLIADLNTKLVSNSQNKNYEIITNDQQMK
ncbi:MAG: hypothetical protein OEL83_17440 [Desulforhopalus sp.]|nr:hypothetical protein [Desulforhopalus sp.]